MLEELKVVKMESVDEIPLTGVKAEPEDFSVSFLDGSSGSNSLPPVSNGAHNANIHVEDENTKSDSDTPQPSVSVPRRRRALKMEVVVPTLEKLMLEKKEVDDEIKKLFKDKGKKSTAFMTVSDKVIKSRLEPIGIKPFEINLPRAEINMMVKRRFMSDVYGGSSEGTFPPIGKEKFAEHGMNDFMYLHLDYQPCAPQIPGKCGLWFCTGSSRGNWDGVYRVLTRDLRRAGWQYMGQYEVKPTKSLTTEEWVSQKDKVKNTWATKICTKTWGQNVRSRIQFRRSTGLRRAPTAQETDDILDSGQWKNITPEDVRAAFDNGEERLRVWTMKCIGYDSRFQLEICAKYPPWAEQQAHNKENGGEKQQKRKKGQTKSKGKKQKKSVTPQSESDSGFESIHEVGEKMAVDWEEDPEIEVISNIRNRGTNSRPNVL